MACTPSTPQPSTTPNGFFPQPAGDGLRKSRTRNPAPTEYGTTQPPTDLREFAERSRLRLRRDLDGTGICVGSLGHLFQYDDNLLGFALVVEGNRGRLDAKLRNRCKRAIRAGFIVLALADYEGIFAFHPSDRELSRLAIKLGGIRRKRRAGGRPFNSATAAKVGKATQFVAPRRVGGPDGVKKAAKPTQLTPSLLEAT